MLRVFVLLFIANFCFCADVLHEPHFLYKIKKERKNCGFILGTVHEPIEIPLELERKIASSDVVIVEIDWARDLVRLARQYEDRRWDFRADRNVLRRILNELHPSGKRDLAIDSLPRGVVNWLGEKLRVLKFTLDGNVSALAAAYNIDVVSLDWSQNDRELDGWADSTLHAYFYDPIKFVRELNGYNAYLNGDETPFIQVIAVRKNDPAVFRHLSSEWQDPILYNLNSGRKVFVAVGLCHVLGDSGLVSELRKAGFTVEKVVK